MDKWIVRNDGEDFSLTLNEIKTKLKLGELSNDALVSKDGEAWSRLIDVVDVFSELDLNLNPNGSVAYIKMPDYSVKMVEIVDSEIMFDRDIVILKTKDKRRIYVHMNNCVVVR